METINIAEVGFQIESSIFIGSSMRGFDSLTASFWKSFLDDFMSSSQITIQNGQVSSSTCKPLNQHGVIYTDPTEPDGKYTIFDKTDDL